VFANINDKVKESKISFFISVGFYVDYLFVYHNLYDLNSPSFSEPQIINAPWDSFE
jgi:hypothetical protein